MRVVEVVHGWPLSQMGGTGLYVEALVKGLRAHDCDVVCVHPTSGDTAEIFVDAGQITLQGPVPRTWPQTWQRSEMLGVWRRWLDVHKPDVVHIHHLSGFPLTLPLVCKTMGIHTVLTLHDYALPCARGQLIDRDLRPCDGPSPVRCAQCLSLELQRSPVHSWVGQQLQRWPKLGQRAQGLVEQRPPRTRDQARISERLLQVDVVLDSVDVLLSPSHDLSNRMKAMGYRQPAVCPLPLVQPITPSPVPTPGPVRFLFASSILPTKGPHLLLEAFRSLPEGDATLGIAGHAPPFARWPGYAEMLQKQVNAQNNAHWYGPVPPAKIPDLLHQHDVVVLPSVWPENSPLIIREATAAGLPVIVSKHGGARELAPGADVVAAGDVSSLRQALQRACSQGRRRLPCPEWQTPKSHALWLFQNAYP